MSLRIGQVDLSSRLVLAPMAGITDTTFRRLARRYGAGLLVSEMISAKALYYGDQKTEILTEVHDLERPMALQIFGSEPKIMAEAAGILSSRPQVAFIDINMGCPAPKIVKNGDGSALMRNPDLAYEVMKATVEGSRVPVTVKMRLGWDEDHKNADQLIDLAQKAGVAAITVHGRTREMFYSGKADWKELKRLRSMSSVPFIGNGDIFSPEDALAMMEITGCDGVAIGRGAIGNPWIFMQIQEFIETGAYHIPTRSEVVDQMRDHLLESVALKGERRGILEMRKPMAQYIKGMPGAKLLRDQMNRMTDLEDLLSLLDALKA